MGTFLSSMYGHAKIFQIFLSETVTPPGLTGRAAIVYNLPQSALRWYKV